MAKPRVLHLSQPLTHNPETIHRFTSQFDLIFTTCEERERKAFIEHLRSQKWGDFEAIIRPLWSEGGEMGDWDNEIVSQLPKSVKIYASAGAGYDWMDIPLLKERGITYCNSAAACTTAVADCAIYLILSVFRNLTWSQLAARSGSPKEWLQGRMDCTTNAHNPEGHTLGIVGLGNIGYLLAQKAFLGLGMKIHYYDIRRRPQDQEDLVGAVHHESLDSLIAASDCVVICVPFAGERLIDSDRLAQFKKGARLINVARGALVDEDALVSALKSGHISAAALDVFEKEPEVHPELTKMMNVTLTTHIGGATIESSLGFERLSMENIESYFLHGKAITPVFG